METRSRILRTDYLPYDRYNRIPGFSGPIYEPNHTQGNYVFQSWQETSSEGHQFRKISKTNEDIGGPFYTKKWEHVESTPRVLKTTHGNNSISKHYSGPVLAAKSGLAYSKLTDYKANFPFNLPDTPVSTLDAFGTRGIARTIPTNPIVDTAQFLGELRMKLPSLPAQGLRNLKRGDIPKKLGDEYLNATFGIMPIIADLKKYAVAVKESEKILNQLARDSGKNVRRRFAFPTQRSTTVTVNPSTYAIIGAYDSAGPSALTTTIEDQVDYWFEGAFTYYLPPQGSFTRYAAEANKLFGLRPSVDLVYELTPWSWAADWFGSTGDVIHNLSAFQNDGLVLRYGYIMEHRVRTITYDIAARYTTTTGVITVPAKQVFRLTTKRRQQATPYGFGLTFDGFSPSQLATMAALGLSKGGNIN